MRDTSWGSFLWYVDFQRETHCWIWTGQTDNGCPRFCQEGTKHRAARFAFERANDLTLGTRTLSRPCDALCVNPDHGQVSTEHHVAPVIVRGPPLARIITAVATVYRVQPELLTEMGRKQPLAEARQVLMFLCYKIKFMSYPQIGQKLGRHHTTVMHGVERVAQRLVSDSRLFARLERIQAELCPSFETV